MEDIFFQSPPILEDPFQSDIWLRMYLKWKLPRGEADELWEEFESFGRWIVEEAQPLADQANSEPPEHIAYNAWGERVDRLRTSQAWVELCRSSAEKGLIADAYEKKYGHWGRLIQFAKLYMFHPSSAFFTCPLAMTDGASRVIELFGSEELKKKLIHRLRSRRPEEFWTSGQWMTETAGGSDVGRTGTLAISEGEAYRLSGVKWFSSATTSEMALALARVKGDPMGSRGLSLFFIELFDEKGSLQNISIRRLKNKLGTKALPTAELDLKGTRALMVGKRGEGVKTVSAMLNITRMYNGICAAGQGMRIYQLAKSYACKREVFGATLDQHPLHMETLAIQYTSVIAANFMVFELLEWLGKQEAGQATEEEAKLLRLLIPVAKMFTAKLCVAHSSEILEAFGGAGYVEDTGIPMYFRDAQVFPIWEGTTNVMSLDVLRVIRKENPMPSFQKHIGSLLEGTQALESEAKELVQRLEGLMKFFESLTSEELLLAGARNVAWCMGEIFVCASAIKMSESHRKSCFLKSLAQRLFSSFNTPLNLPHTNLENHQFLFPTKG